LTSDARIVDVPGVPRFEIAPHHCFACGTLNDSGMGLVLHVEPGRAWTETTLEQRFQGWDDIAHGGILCAILDEVMAWSLVAEDNWGLTARMSVEFRRPVEIGHPIRAEGWITRSRRRLIDTAARIVDLGTDQELATASGIYVAADEARKQQLRDRYAYVPLAGAPEPATTSR
jgi:acyl-coenzyme A thioesterase PaaI-like protein